MPRGVHHGILTTPATVAAASSSAAGHVAAAGSDQLPMVVLGLAMVLGGLLFLLLTRRADDV